MGLAAGDQTRAWTKQIQRDHCATARVTSQYLCMFIVETNLLIGTSIKLESKSSVWFILGNYTHEDHSQKRDSMFPISKIITLPFYATGYIEVSGL